MHKATERLILTLATILSILILIWGFTPTRSDSAPTPECPRTQPPATWTIRYQTEQHVKETETTDDAYYAISFVRTIKQLGYTIQYIGRKVNCTP
jgi:hypothetical protein